MKRFILILTAALLAATTAHAVTWARTYGGEGSESGQCVQRTSDNNYIISGIRNDSLWLLKIDTLGNVLWSKVHGASSRMKGRWVEQTSDDDYIVASRVPSLLKTNAQGDTLWTFNYAMYSYCVQETSDGGYIVVGGDNGYEADEHLILVKTNANGNTLWTKTYGELPRNRNAGFFVRETSDNGYIITGWTGIDTEEFATGYLWLIKTDANGDTLWTREYGSGEIGEFNKGYCIRQTSDGGYIITGYRDYGGLWLLKTDADGDTVWTKIYCTPSGGTGYNVAETYEGGYIIIGTTESLLLLSQGKGRDLWLLKTDPQGDTLWTRIYGGDGYDVGRCVIQTDDGGYLVTGSTTSYGVGGTADIWLLKTDSLGLLSISEKPIVGKGINWEVASSIGPQVTIRYFDRPQGLHASVFNVVGREVDSFHGTGSSGIITWGYDHPPGVYFIKVFDVTPQVSTARVVLIH